MTDESQETMPIARLGQVMTYIKDEPSARQQVGLLLEGLVKAASDPAISVEKMERLEAMFERISARQAKADFDEAFARLQPILPEVRKNGKITFTDKNGEVRATPFATLEDINDAVKPLLAEHGFSLRHRVETTAEGRILVTAVLAHGGHREEVAFPPLAADTSGSKNNVQGMGSSMTYARRYTTVAILNITTRGMDDDGKAAGDMPVDPLISAEQADSLRKLLQQTKGGEAKFLQFAQIERLEDMVSSKFGMARKLVQDTIERERKSGAPAESKK